MFLSKPSKLIQIFLLLYVVKIGFFIEGLALAQVSPPDRDYLFLEDRNKKETEKQRRDNIKAKKQQVKARSQSGQALPFDINATRLNFDSAKNTLIADGNVIISYGSAIAEANHGEFNIDTSESELSGDVRVTDITSNVLATSAQLNFKTGIGKLINPQIYFAEGDYFMRASQADKLGEETFTLKDAELTTCNCPEPEGCNPWRIRADRAKITREGYGQVWNAVLDIKDFPVFYTPYLFFPAKNQRQSGLLPFRFGTSKKGGFEVDAPLYLVFSDSSDATLTSIIQPETRYGLDTQVRKIFSKDSFLETGLTFLNEGPRNGELRGTRTDGLEDPSLETNRLGGYWDQQSLFELSNHPFQFIANGGYVSDDLFLREFSNEKIAPFNSRFVTSRAVLRTSLFETYSADLSAEFNQSMVSNDDFVFQRLPEIEVNGFQTFRPFGENPLGAKLVLASQLAETNFSRKESFDGTRSEVYERLQVPFHFRNIFEGTVEGDLRGSYYKLQENRVFTQSSSAEEPKTVQEILDTASDRLIPGFRASLSTVIEKIYPVEDNSWVKTIGELGPLGRGQQLVRVKHTVQPLVRYRYVPFVDQSANPQFDSLDKLARRNVVTYGLVQRLFARYEPRNQYVYGIEETTPDLKDIESLRLNSPIDQKYAFGFDDLTGSYTSIRSGALRELANFSLSQSLDLDEEANNRDPKNDALSDLNAKLSLFPNDHLGFYTSSDFDVNSQKFSSYTVEGQLIDKRADELRSRLTFFEHSVRQLESSIEVALTDRIKAGYYSRYDDLTSQFIESRFGLRLFSSCKCWVFDIDVADKINPKETKVTFNVTLVGLGELGNSFLAFDERNRNFN